jgi:predicted  nucleic acid-binding Zn-ribbon protein
MADTDRDALDELYWAKPDGFIALRTKLSSAAKRQGDQDTARRISITNKPTTAAWVVNRLAIGHREARQRLSDLGDRLRAAHAAMDGDQIRDLSAEQRKLIDELTKAAFDAAELSNPSAAIRDDVGATLQAAIADPDVRAALGRLTRPERWSGFGAFGDAAPAKQVGAKRAPKKSGKDTRAASKQAAARESRLRAAREQQERLKTALAAAEQAKSEADEALSERRDELVAARARQEEARQSLRAADEELGIAEQGYDKAQQTGRDAADLVRETKAQLRRAR